MEGRADRCAPRVGAVSVDLVLRLPAGLDRITVAARRSLCVFDGVVDSELRESLELLVSELVTNSLRHAGLGPEGWVELRVTAEPERVRAEVVDSGPGFSGAPVPGGQTAGSGWGFYLVDRLAAEWSVGDGARATVWFVLVGQDQGAGVR